MSALRKCKFLNRVNNKNGQDCSIGTFDMLIGVHTKSLKMILMTNNTKEFERIKELKLED